MTRIPVGVIVGSNRRESINRRLALALTRLVEDRFAWRWIRTRHDEPGPMQKSSRYGRLSVSGNFG